jgi:hypothetical protein
VLTDAGALGGRVKPTAVRFKFLDWVHGIDSSGFRTFGDDSDSEGGQCHALPE